LDGFTIPKSNCSHWFRVSCIEERKIMNDDLAEVLHRLGSAAPGTGKMNQASEWKRKLTEYDEASRRQKPGER